MPAVPAAAAQTAENTEFAKILIVDDNVLTAQALAKLLASANYATVVSLTGADALAWAAEGSLSGAVIDVHLPDMNGLVLSQQLRGIMGPGKPIILVSGDTSMEIINSLKHVGATYFFSKPVNAKLLVDQLRQWTEGRSPATSEGSTGQ